jgi:hypothetical protein
LQESDRRCPYQCSQFGRNPGNDGIERIKSSAVRSVSLFARIQESHSVCQGSNGNRYYQDEQHE